MGAIRLFSSSSNDCCNSNKKYEAFTPSPEVHNYTIVKSISISEHLVVMIRYKDAKNYEGLKVMVYRYCSIGQLKRQSLIDPHFAKDKTLHSPFARFEPTAQGWDMAMRLAEILH